MTIAPTSNEREAEARRIAWAYRGMDMIAMAEYLLLRASFGFDDAYAIFMRAIWLHDKGGIDPAPSAAEEGE